ncbi:MAG: MBOAT family protein [Bacteroidetes bacterium]|nr:MBOAT family protein [Bacteroidota bacterium]
MLFSSLEFAFFLPLLFVLIWLLNRNSLQLQNCVLLIASYFFYACWDWRFLFLLAFSTGLDFYTGSKIHKSKNLKTRRIWLGLSVVINLGFLGFFKYFNFFIENFSVLLESFGLHAHASTLNIILPVGISFYTFHGLSYLFDIYNKKIEPCASVVNYSLFVSFFPLLVAGPIERATHLLPQLEKPRTWSYPKAVDGLKQILWGLFKKIVIADNCANYSNLIFNHSSDYSGSTLFLGAVFFAFQIYGDFSGYSDIALGTARLLGIELLRNFSFPYFSRDIAEFWRRWHISLTSWFRDYLYIPLGGSRLGMARTVLNTFIIFLISGFWHGANWTFIAWGVLNALYILPSILLKRNRTHLDTVANGKIFPNIRDAVNILVTFLLTVFAWIFFRSENLVQAFAIVGEVFSASLFLPPLLPSKMLCLLLLFFLCIEWIGRSNAYAIESTGNTWNRVFRWSFYYVLVLAIFLLRPVQEQPFIYFQF